MRYKTSKAPLKLMEQQKNLKKSWGKLQQVKEHPEPGHSSQLQGQPE